MSELSLIKHSVDLNRIALAHGFKHTNRCRWVGHETWLDRDGKKIYISHRDHGWFFWKPSTEEKGSSIDFLMTQCGMSKATAIAELKLWDGHPIVEVAKDATPAIKKDFQAVQKALTEMKRVARSEYLEGRGIPAVIVAHWRFAGRILQDQKGNMVFPHSNEAGFCGAEVRNKKFKGFLKDGSRGLWLSKATANDKRLVVVESAIDGLAHAALADDGRTRYASLGGTPSAAQGLLLEREIQRLPAGSSVVAGTDCDDAGDRAAEFIKVACEVADRKYVRELPWVGKDWNECLEADRTPRMERMRSLIPA